MSQSFRPQRLYPRFARLYEAASVLPDGLPATKAIVGRWTADRTPSATEAPGASDLETAQVALSGFPRTGTTFAKRAINEALGAPSACWKNHDALALRTYRSAGLVTGITIRDPLETVASWAIYHADEPDPVTMHRRLRIWNAWHHEALRFVKAHRVHVLRFREFSADPTRMVARVCEGLPFDTSNIASVAELVRLDNAREEIPLTRQNLPHQARSDAKSAYLEALQVHRMERTRRVAFRIYDELDRLAERDVRNFHDSRVTPRMRRTAFAVGAAGASAAGVSAITHFL